MNKSHVSRFKSYSFETLDMKTILIFLNFGSDSWTVSPNSGENSYIIQF